VSKVTAEAKVLQTGFDMSDLPRLSLVVRLSAGFRSYNICRLKERTVSADKINGTAGRGDRAFVSKEWLRHGMNKGEKRIFHR
jgi:hypothetical protein